MSSNHNKHHKQMSNYREIYQAIECMINYNNSITPNQIYENLIKSGLIDDNSKYYPINFDEAQQLDETFFGFGGTRWMRAFSRPSNGLTIDFEGSKWCAENCGIFTFDLNYLGGSEDASESLPC